MVGIRWDLFWFFLGIVFLDFKFNGKISVVFFIYIMFINMVGCFIVIVFFFVIKLGI